MSCNKCQSSPCCCGVPYQLPGPMGPQGPAGIQGNQGQRGTPGTPGTPGTNGTNGLNGGPFAVEINPVFG